MKRIEYKSIIEEYDSVREMDDSDQALLKAARDASRHAYAPYSRFFVGAAVELEDGTVITANNQENVAYPSGLCAERIALFAAGANHPGKAIRRIAISARTEAFELYEPVYPCGACRQVMSEYERLSGSAMQIIMSSEQGKVHKVNGLINLLPVAFDADNLKRN